MSRKKRLVLMVVAGTVTLLLVSAFFQRSSARRFWGKEVRNRGDWFTKKCAYRDICEERYFLWIKVSEKCGTVKVACVGEPIPDTWEPVLR